MILSDGTRARGVTLLPCYPFASATQPDVILALRARGVTLIPCYPCGRGRIWWAEQGERAGGHEDAHKRADDVYHAPEGLSASLLLSHQQPRTSQIAQHEAARLLRTRNAAARSRRLGGSPFMKLRLRDPERDAGHAFALRPCTRLRIDMETKGFHNSDHTSPRCTNAGIEAVCGFWPHEVEN